LREEEKKTSSCLRWHSFEHAAHAPEGDSLIGQLAAGKTSSPSEAIAPLVFFGECHHGMGGQGGKVGKKLTFQRFKLLLS